MLRSAVKTRQRSTVKTPSKASSPKSKRPTTATKRSKPLTTSTKSLTTLQTQTPSIDKSISRDKTVTTFTTLQTHSSPNLLQKSTLTTKQPQTSLSTPSSARFGHNTTPTILNAAFTNRTSAFSTSISKRPQSFNNTANPTLRSFSHLASARNQSAFASTITHLTKQHLSTQNDNDAVMSAPETVVDATAPAVEQQAQPEQQQQKQQKPKKQKEKKAAPAQVTDASSLGVQAKKGEDFSKWYSQLVVRSELIDYYDISGCYILRPWAYEIWEQITAFLDGEFKKLGVKNASFPLLVPKANLEKEEDHIEGFAAEVAWVTHSGSTKLDEPVAIRPTSETIMYPAFAKWIHSHRDLPLLLNQWCNVLRWEFKDPTPFIRSREFLWQEGHTAHAKQAEADKEVYKILDIYEAAYEELLACSVIKGHKTPFEKFAGGNFTTTVEGYIPGSGRGIQAATSHSLGQNFAKMFNVSFQDENGENQHVWQNSWGFTTRSIGVMLMTHSDDKGLVLPPRIAPTQVVLIPIIKGDNAADVNAAINTLYSELKAKGIRAQVDDRTNVSPGFKYNHYELKGVPIRVEVGARDLEKKSAVLARRDLGTKSFVSWEGFADSVQGLLDTIQQDLRAKAKKDHLAAITTATTWDSFMAQINKNLLALVPWCGETECEQNIKVKSGESAKDAGAERSGAAKSLCIPFQQPELDVKQEKCLHCSKQAEKWVLFGRSY